MVATPRMHGMIDARQGAQPTHGIMASYLATRGVNLYTLCQPSDLFRFFVASGDHRKSS